MSATKTHVIGKPGALKAAMGGQGLSVRALALEAGISTALAGFLRNETTGVSLDRAERVAGALNTPLADLFTHKNGDPIGPPK